MPYKDPIKKKECERKASRKWRINNPEYLKDWRNNNSEYFLYKNRKEYFDSYLKINGNKISKDRIIRGMNKAYSILKRAIAKGNIASLKDNIIKCTYCNNRADRYDHRDYNYPLIVQPVCRSCNKLLPKAISIKEHS